MDSDGNIQNKNQSPYTSVLPKISIGLDYIFKPSVQSFVLRTELMSSAIRTDLTSTYQFSNNVDEVLTNNYKMLGIIVGLTPQIIWNFYNTEKMKVYLGAGPSGRLIIYPEKSLYQTTNKTGPGYADKELENYFKLKNTFVNVMVKAGITINKKMDASIGWYSGMELTNDATPRVASIRENSIHLNFYYFLKRK